MTHVNSVYQLIAAVDGWPLHLAAHADIAREAFFALYGVDAGLDDERLLDDLRRLLAERGFAKGGVLLEMNLTPGWREDAPATPGVKLSLEVCGRLLYPRYVLWHTRPAAAVTEYESFLSEWPCTTSRINACYAGRYVRREQAGAAVHVVRGAVTGAAYEVWCDEGSGVSSEGGAGEYPLFCVSGGRVCTPSRASGAQDSVPRRLGLAALKRLSVSVDQREVVQGELAAFDEVFMITPQGAVSLYGCSGVLYFSLFAEKIAAVLPSLSAETLL